MMAPTQELVRSESVPGTYRECVSCQRRTHKDEMLDEWECKRCREGHLDKMRRRKLTDELAAQKKAVGQAVNGMVLAIGRCEFEPNEPHLVYQAILEKRGGVQGFSTLFWDAFDSARNAEQVSHKVILDYLKAVIVLGDVAQKTAPPPPNFNGMSDEEMADEFARLVQQKMVEIQEIKELKLLAEQVAENPVDAADTLSLFPQPEEA